MGNVQDRNVSCVCDGVVASMDKCVAVQEEPLMQECVEYVNCKWKWSRWTACSEVCGGGNTTRVPQCFCDEIILPVPDDKCDVNLWYGRETVPCNTFVCGGTSAKNKQYWLNREDTWTIENRRFNCSQGYSDDDPDSPMGKTYEQVLSDTEPATHPHYKWYFLAKEWITAQLNIVNGVVFSPEEMDVINTVSGLLEYCKGFTEDQEPLIYALKEKLGRMNNNIGGLSNVDDEVALRTNGRTVRDIDSLNRMTFILAIAVPLVAVVIIAVALGLTIYYVRDKTTVAKEEFESEDEEEPLQNTTGMETRLNNDQVPLEMEQVPTTRDESTSEEQL